MWNFGPSNWTHYTNCFQDYNRDAAWDSEYNRDGACNLSFFIASFGDFGRSAFSLWSIAAVATQHTIMLDHLCGSMAAWNPTQKSHPVLTLCQPKNRLQAVKCWCREKGEILFRYSSRSHKFDHVFHHPFKKTLLVETKGQHYRPIKFVIYMISKRFQEHVMIFSYWCWNGGYEI